jgi:AraC family transcriptional regulator
LVLNRDQTYSIEIDSKTPVESFCLFFAPGFVEEVHKSLSTGASELLDDPVATTSERLEFFEKTYPHDSLVSPRIFALKNALPSRGRDALWLQSKLHEIAHALLLAHERECQRVCSVAALRASTREELYRRLHRAHDYILAKYDQPIDLQMLAAVACLSSNHFLRTFAQVFGQTPHQFLTATRLTKAHQLLVGTELSVTDVCLNVGFESLGSFSSLFRRHFGFSASACRKR